MQEHASWLTRIWMPLDDILTLGFTQCIYSSKYSEYSVKYLTNVKLKWYSHVRDVIAFFQACTFIKQ
jgi:hypothetical protein